VQEQWRGFILCGSADLGSADAPVEDRGNRDAGDVSRASILSAAAEALLPSADAVERELIAMACTLPPHALHERLFVVPMSEELAVEPNPALRHFAKFWARWVDAVNGALGPALACAAPHGSNARLARDVSDVLDRRFVLACVISKRDVASPGLWAALMNRVRGLDDARAGDLQLDNDLFATTFVYSVVGPEILRQYGFDLAVVMAADAAPINDAKDRQQRAKMTAADAEKAVAEAAAHATACEIDWEVDDTELHIAQAECERLCVELDRAKAELNAATDAVAHLTTRTGDGETPAIRPMARFAARGEFEGDKWVENRSKGGCKLHDRHVATCKWCWQTKEMNDRNMQKLATFVKNRTKLLRVPTPMSLPKSRLFDINRQLQSCDQFEVELRLINVMFEQRALKRCAPQPERPVPLVLEAWFAALGDFAEKVDNWADRLDNTRGSSPDSHSPDKGRFLPMSGKKSSSRIDSIERLCKMGDSARESMAAVRDRVIREAVLAVRNHLEGCKDCGAAEADHRHGAMYVASSLPAHSSSSVNTRHIFARAPLSRY
jgi:hypothetical protein